MLNERIITVGNQIELITRQLRVLGYSFQYPNEVFPGPEPGTEEAIERVEREVGEIPLALKLFWRHIGSVNFIGQHDEWSDSEYPDPLVIYPPSYAIDELDDFLADREERMRYNFPYLVPIAPDDFHKAGVSGGMWYNVSVPAVADDPPLNDERHKTTLVNYLELAIRWGGFPGLDSYPDHTWPIAQIIAVLEK